MCLLMLNMCHLYTFALRTLAASSLLLGPFCSIPSRPDRWGSVPNAFCRYNNTQMHGSSYLEANTQTIPEPRHKYIS